MYIFWKSGILVRNIWLFWGKNCWGNLFHLLLGKNSYYTDCFFQKHVYVFSYWSPTAIVVVKLMMGNRYGIGLNVKWPSFRGMEATLWTVFPINLSTGHGMMTRSLFQLSRWEREFLFFDLMFRDKNFFLSILGFDTRRRIEIKTISARMFENAIFAFSVLIFSRKFVKYVFFLEKCLWTFLFF